MVRWCLLVCGLATALRVPVPSSIARARARRVATLEIPEVAAPVTPSIDVLETVQRTPDGLQTAAPADGRYAIPAHWSDGALVQRSVARWAPVAVAAAAAGGALDGCVRRVWAVVYGSRYAHAPMFEAWTATVGFVWAIAFWSAAHRLLFRERGARAAAFRFDGRPPTAPFEWAGDSGWRRLAGAWVPLVAYVGSIRLFHGLVAKAALPLAAPSGLRVLCEVGFGVLAYDAVFAPIHASLHSRRFPRRWRAIHGTHHSARPSKRGSLCPLETVQHSYADGFLQVAVNVFVQRLPTPLLHAGGLALAPKHPLSRVLHNLVVTYLLVEAHSGYDLPWMTHRAWPRVFGGARAHEAHHVHGDRHFHQFLDLDLRGAK